MLIVFSCMEATPVMLMVCLMQSLCTAIFVSVTSSRVVVVVFVVVAFVVADDFMVFEVYTINNKKK